jgi:PAS domain S-box-containing protein
MSFDPDLLAQLRAHSRDQAAFEQLVQLFEIHRHSAEAKALHALYQLSLELTSLPNLDSLCRQAVAQGVAQLGFERLALYLLDLQSERLIGTYGTDRHGYLRDERALSLSAAQLTWRQAVDEAPMRACMWANAPLYDGQEVVGTGWQIAAALWDGKQTLGYLVADNLVRQRPPRAYEETLFSLYSSLLGRLIALQRSNAQLRRIQELLQDTQRLAAIGVWELDLETLQIYWSDQVYHIHGLPVGQPPSFEEAVNFYPPESRSIILEAIRLAQERGTAWDMEVPFVNAQGKRLWVRVVGKALRDEQGVVKRLYGFFQDLTTLHEAQQHASDLAVEREKVSLLQSFLQDMSHDFRTPFTAQQNAIYLINRLIEKLNEQLTAIERYAGDRLPLQAQATLKACSELSSQIAHQGEVLKSSGRRAVKLVDQLLDVARAEQLGSFERAPCDLNALLARIVDTYQPLVAERALTLTFEPAQALPLVWVNADLLSRAVNNLLDNAMQYTPRGGKIVVRTAHDAQGVLIEVEDDGIGIAEEHLPHIFERFYRANRPQHGSGSGLGLSIVKRVIEAHGGTVSVRSQLNCGTTFTLRLPHQAETSGSIGSTSSASESR